MGSPVVAARMSPAVVPEFSNVPTMNLKISCRDGHLINAKADNREALVYVIELSKGALQFCCNLADQCSGAPMAQLFTILGDGQTRHL